MSKKVGERGLWDRATTALSEVREVVVRTSQVGKIKLDAAFVRRERDRLVLQLGEELLARIEDGSLEPPSEVESLLAEIRAQEERLRQQEQEIALVEAEAGHRRERAEADEAYAKAVEEDVSGDPYRDPDDTVRK